MTYRLENTDALSFAKTIKSGSVNLVQTDPPYAISRETNFASGEAKGDETDRFRVSFDFGEWDVVDLDYFEKLFTEYYRVLKKGGVLIIFYDMWKMQDLKTILEKIGFGKFRMITWEKTNPVPINRQSFPLSTASEYAIVCSKPGRSTYNMYWYEDFLASIGETRESLRDKIKNQKMKISVPYSPQDYGIFKHPIAHRPNRFHTTEKSLSLMEDLIKVFSNEGDVVLDTFLGSGTTAVACRNTNRIPYGCELSNEYFEKLLTRFHSGQE